VLDGISTLLRLASRIACLIVLVSFVLFVVEQAGSASKQQQNEVNEAAPVTSRSAPAKTTAKQKSGIREAIDEASSTLTSPFKGITSGSNNQWAIRGVGLVLALIVYGFGLGFLARMTRVRV
jgi:hypothetical protein